MAGANLVAIHNVFGAEALKRVKTCEFPFKQNRNKMATLFDAEHAAVFKEKCEALLLAETVDGYSSALHELQMFIEESSTERESLSS